jgi:hypothetical protein
VAQTSFCSSVERSPAKNSVPFVGDGLPRYKQQEGVLGSFEALQRAARVYAASRVPDDLKRTDFDFDGIRPGI